MQDNEQNIASSRRIYLRHSLYLDIFHIEKWVEMAVENSGHPLFTISRISVVARTTPRTDHRIHNFWSLFSLK